MNNLFKGYVPTNNKRATQKWKNAELLTLEQAQEYEEYAGILAQDTICLDCDNGTQAEIVSKIVKDNGVKCKIIQTTRGKHFYFKGKAVKKCLTAEVLACGLKADFKCGWANSYTVLKYGGVERVCEYDPGEYDDVPHYFMPVGKKDPEFLGMKDGGGRNSGLFAYLLRLQGYGFNNEECRQVVKIINEYVFDGRLDDDEIATITRDEAFKKEVFFIKGKFLHDKFGNWLASEEHIKKMNNQLHIYQDGVYLPGFERIEQAMIKHIPSIKDAQRKEVLKYLNIYLKNENKVIDARYVAFKNGVLDLATNRMLEFSPERVITNKIDWNYNPDTYSRIADDALNKISCGKQEVRALIEECAGYCLYRRQELGKAFIFLGGPAGGKSTVLDIIKTMLGWDNVSSLEMQELGDRFNTAMLHNRLANIGDDISDDFMRGREVSLFKKIVTGNRIKGELKGQQPFEFEPYTKLIFSANSMPRTKDITGAVLRRLVIIPFNAKFDNNSEGYDPWIKYKLCEDEAIEYLINLSIKALKRVLKNNRFTECEDVLAELQEYEFENNPVLTFLNDTDEEEIIGAQVRDLYYRYSTFCRENGYQPLTNINFGKYIRKRLGLVTKNTTVNGESLYIYAKK